MSRPVPLKRSDFPVTQPLQTRWSDNDIYGHMNNTVHYQLFDTALNMWLIGEGLLEPSRSETIGVVVDTGCSYFAELAYPQPVLAGLRVERLGRSSVTYRIALFGDGETAAAQGHFTQVLVDRKTRRPVPISDRWRDVLTRASIPEPCS
ncbi:acyl-CoA thioesterase [Roseibium sp. SCP14]|uniref:acyl-CoA thioesterase n=1 Tax=Roseibium sp. SCP14 TaxID=3141375 RepID=UPI00333A0542